MVFLVPFDGSPVSEAALARAIEHGRALEQEVVAVSFVPTGTEYAERRKWVHPDEEFAAETASAALRRKIEEATDEAERTFTESGAQSPGGLTDHVRRVARDVDASVLFVGTDDTEDTENPGLPTPFGEVGNGGDYDVYLVRAAR
jgi:nucleotide-binding universal stress UspA family protein